MIPAGRGAVYAVLMEDTADYVTGGPSGFARRTLIPLDDFKAILGIDDRDNILSRYCLITATYTIEHYCKRRLLRRKNTDYLSFAGEYIFTLREYPVRRVLSVFTAGGAMPGEPRFSPENLVERDHYYCLPDEGSCEDIPFSLVLRFPLRLAEGEAGIKVRYLSGYVPGKAGMPFGVPADLASACLELAAWNMNRYRGRRSGMTGNVRGSGKEGEHLEMSMPENVRGLLEPYKRRII
jgi:hypothetical protein